MKKLIGFIMPWCMVIFILGFSHVQAQLMVIDGEKDAFYETLTGPDDGYLQLRAFHGNDNGYPEGDADLSAKVWTAWDEDCLYIYEEVTDDVISMTSRNTYQNDCIEIKVDPMATDSVRNSVISFDMTALDTTGGITGVATIDSSFRKITEDGYVLEAAIPWSDIVSGDETVSVAVDSVFGLCIQNHDNDNPNGARDASVQWAAVLLDAAWNQPKYLATAKFLPDNKLQLIPSNNMTGVTNTLPYDGSVPAEIIVDGKRDPFYNLLSGPEEGYLELMSYAFNDNGVPHGDNDLSAKLWVAWDPTWFYLYTEVTDDTISADGTANPWEAYLTDNLEIKIDGDPTDSTETTLSFDTGLTVLDSSETTEPTNQMDNLADSLKQYARIVDRRSYSLEIAVKWSALGGTEEIEAEVGNIFGFGVGLHDNDGKSRQASLQWAAVMLDAMWNTPKYLGTARLLDDNKIELIPTNNMTGVTNEIPYDGTPFYMRIDGKKDPFYYGLEDPDEGHIQIQHCHYSNLGQPADNNDLSAKIWGSWDNDWLYLYAEILDDTVACPNTANYFRNDCIELKVDGVPDDSTQNSVSFGTALTALDSSEADGLTNQMDEIKNPENKQYARGDLDGGYTLEMAVKLDTLGGSEDIVAAVGEKFGLGINIVDNDGTEPSDNRQASIVWAAVCDDKIWNTPKYHGTVEFQSNHELDFIATNNMTGYGHGIPYDGESCPVSLVDDHSAASPLEFSLSQNYPNPFNPTTTISYVIPTNSKVRLVVYDVLGKKVATLINEVQKAGAHITKFDGKQYASGIYFFKLETDSHVQVKKMMMLK